MQVLQGKSDSRPMNPGHILMQIHFTNLSTKHSQLMMSDSSELTRLALEISLGGAHVRNDVGDSWIKHFSADILFGGMTALPFDLTKVGTLREAGTVSMDDINLL